MTHVPNRAGGPWWMLFVAALAFPSVADAQNEDPQMPINQSHELEGMYESLGLDVFFDVVHGAVHGDGNREPRFFSPARIERAVAFLKRTLGS